MTATRALLLATALALPGAAMAQPVNGIYVAGGAGLNWLTDSDGGNLQSFIDASDVNATNLGLTPSGNFNASFDMGFVGVLSVGYGFGNGLRLELEGNFRYNEVDSVTARGFGGATTSGGRAKTYGLMVNALYDFGATQGWAVQPYLGVGAGYAWQEYDGVNVRARSTAGSALPQFQVDGTDGRFAYQAIVGAALPIRSVPGLALTAEYRFFGTLSPDIDATARNANGVIRRTQVEVDNFNHSVLLGVRYAFGAAPPPAPAPAVAPAPARTFLVFFDWDRYNLTERARQIIGEAAQASRTQQVTRIEVNGYTDTSGSPQYNQGLSIRRANAVAAELVRLGIPRGSITAQGFGETNLLVPTPDNTREPQNRRVEIILR